jgi:hypothetical protein
MTEIEAWIINTSASSGEERGYFLIILVEGTRKPRPMAENFTDKSLFDG